MASQRRVALEGVWDHDDPAPVGEDLIRGARARMGEVGGETVVGVGLLLEGDVVVLAAPVRVLRLRGEGSAGGGVGEGASKSEGWLRVATMMAIVGLFAMRGCYGERYCGCDWMCEAWWRSD